VSIECVYIDTFAAYVDAVDASSRCVDKFRLHRHGTAGGRGLPRSGAGSQRGVRERRLVGAPMPRAPGARTRTPPPARDRGTGAEGTRASGYPDMRPLIRLSGYPDGGRFTRSQPSSPRTRSCAGIGGSWPGSGTTADGVDPAGPRTVPRRRPVRRSTVSFDGSGGPLRNARGGVSPHTLPSGLEDATSVL
jgi:hypothetical protein